MRSAGAGWSPPNPATLAFGPGSENTMKNTELYIVLIMVIVFLAIPLAVKLY